MQRGQGLRLSDKLMYSTMRIISKKADEWYSGTGFVFRTEDNIPVIVSNKHVIDGFNIGQFVMTQGDEYNEPAIGKVINFEVKDFSKQWILHPDSKVDLAVMPLRVVAHEWSKREVKPFYTSIDSSTIPTDQEWDQFIPLEDILMIGYPNGLGDSFNSLPLFRKGITATHPAINYERKRGVCGRYWDPISVPPGLQFSFLQTSFMRNPEKNRVDLLNVRLLGIVQNVFTYIAEGRIVRRNLKREGDHIVKTH